MVTGLPEIEDKHVCDTCIITKQRRASILAKAKYKADAALDLVHGDLCGLITIATTGGRRFFLLLVDDATWFMWIKLIYAKSDAAAAIKEIEASTKLKVRRPLWVLCTDNDDEFITKEFVTYCANKGIKHHFSTPYTPQ
jgi:hypothetical protein